MPYVDRFGWCVDQSRRARAVRADNAGERFVPHLFSSFFSILDPRRALAVDLSLAAPSLPFPLLPLLLPSLLLLSFLFFFLLVPFLIRWIASSPCFVFFHLLTPLLLLLLFLFISRLFFIFLRRSSSSSSPSLHPSTSTRYRHRAFSLVFRRVFMRLRWIYSRIPLASSRRPTRWSFVGLVISRRRES